MVTYEETEVKYLAQSWRTDHSLHVLWWYVSQGQRLI